MNSGILKRSQFLMMVASISVKRWVDERYSYVAVIKSIDKDGYRIVYQDDDIENKQTLLIEVLPARNFQRTGTWTIKPNKTLVWFIIAKIRIPSNGRSGFVYASRSGMGTVVLQATKSVDERRLPRSRASTNSKVKLLWIVLDSVFRQLKFFVRRQYFRLYSFL